MPTLPQNLHSLCTAFLRELNRILDDKLAAVYLHGATVFPETGATGDIDCHVLLREPPDEQERRTLAELHQALARDFPPLGGELDAYYILMADARQAAPPRHQLRPEIVDGSWALHRAHMLAGRCIVLWGPEPQQVLPPPTWPELDQALQGELEYVQQHLDRYPAYCVLNLCRLLFSYTTGDVVISKRASADWALEALSQWRPAVEAALRAYDGLATTQDEALLRSQVRPLFHFARRRIETSRGR